MRSLTLVKPKVISETRKLSAQRILLARKPMQSAVSSPRPMAGRKVA